MKVIEVLGVTVCVNVELKSFVDLEYFSIHCLYRGNHYSTKKKKKL